MNINNIVNKYKPLMVQFIKFSCVGLFNTFLSLAIYYFCLFIGLHYLVANTFAFLLTVLTSYFLNKKFVFKSNANTRNSLIKTYMVYLLTFCIGSVLLVIMVEKIGISEFIAPFINIVVNVSINFTLIKFWAMK